MSGTVAVLLVVAATIAAIVRDEPDDQVLTVGLGEPTNVTDLASGDGRLWVGGSDDDGHYLAELDPDSGEQLWRHELPGAPPSRIAYGLGLVWIVQGNVLAFDPDSFEPVSDELAVMVGDAGLGISAIDFSATFAWAADAAGQRVLRIEPDREDGSVIGATVEELALEASPSELVVSGDGTVWVSMPSAGSVAVVVLERLSVVSTVPWTGPLLAGGRVDLVWSTEADDLVEVFLSQIPYSPETAVARRLPIGGARFAVSRGAGLVVATDSEVFVLTEGDLDVGTFDSERVVTVEHPSIAALASAGSSIWYVDAGARLHRVEPTTDTGYHIEPGAAPTGTVVQLRGLGHPVRGEELPVRLDGDEVQRVVVDEDGAFLVRFWITSQVPIGRHEISIGDITVTHIDVVPAAVGISYEHSLYTHCGVRAMHFDGRLWLADPIPDGGWWHEEDTLGTVTLQPDGTLEFRDRQGNTARFVEAPPGAENPIAGCE